VREEGAIPLILACTNIDESNPFAKEWAILAIRNLCECNPENQALIAALQPQHVQSVPPELRQKGVGVELDAQTGKLKVLHQGSGGGGGRAGGMRMAEEYTGEYQGVEHPERRAQELRLMGLTAEDLATSEPRPPLPSAAAACGGGGGATESGYAAAGGGSSVPAPEGGGSKASKAAEAAEAEEDPAEEMAAELRGMGLHAKVDPDTGLMDIRHPSAPPSTFHYPLREAEEGPLP
jgi:hypothetical protein